MKLGTGIFKNKMVKGALLGVGAGLAAGYILKSTNLNLGGFGQYVPLLAAYMAGGVYGLVGQFVIGGGLATVAPQASF